MIQVRTMQTHSQPPQQVGCHSRVPNLSASDVSNAEHELEDAIPSADDSRVRNCNRPASLLGVRYACKHNANGDGVHDHAKHRLYHDQPSSSPAFIWVCVSVACNNLGC